MKRINIMVLDTRIVDIELCHYITATRWCFTGRLSVCLSEYVKTAARIFVKFFPRMYLWTRKLPLNFESHSRSDPDLGIFWRILHRCKIWHLSTIWPWWWCALSKCSRFVVWSTQHCVVWSTQHCVVWSTQHCVVWSTLHCVVWSTLHCVVWSTQRRVVWSTQHRVVWSTQHCVILSVIAALLCCHALVQVISADACCHCSLRQRMPNVIWSWELPSFCRFWYGTLR